ncbi:MAG: hypothetical protein OXC08_01560 [Thiotrichales bacterium]|nr:hypothetical protein [Thiotrichales bacterium]
MNRVAMVRHFVDGPGGPVLVSVPVSWTSLRRVDDFERVAAGGSMFRPDDLAALREIVDSLLEQGEKCNQK